MKNYFTKYIAYIRDNPNHYWFKRKLYGWGWTPATREGWLVLFGFMVLIAGNAVRLEMTVQSIESETKFVTLFIGQTLLLVLILITICYKTGESPRWQWGIPKDDELETKRP